MERPKRKNIRLPGYDYSGAGGYFVTICTHQHRCILSRIREGSQFESNSVLLTDIGRITEAVLQQMAVYQTVSVDAYVIMPNHIHMILLVREKMTEKNITVGRFVGAFKSLVTKYWREVCNRQGTTMGKLWQRNYYEHILRNEADYLEKYKYIAENPDKWTTDDLHIAEEYH